MDEPKLVIENIETAEPSHEQARTDTDEPKYGKSSTASDDPIRP
jgi:hypothetical protein